MPNKMIFTKIFDDTAGWTASINVTIEYSVTGALPATDICEYIEATADAAAVLFGIAGATDKPQETDDTRESLKVTVKSGVDPEAVAKAIHETIGGDIHAVQMDTRPPRQRGRIPGAI